MRRENLVVEHDDKLTLKRCMERIDENRAGFVFVVNAERQPVGLLTDGDIRRALLLGAALTESALTHVNRAFVHTEKGGSREAILKLFDAKIRFVPVLADGRLDDIVTLEDLRYEESHNAIFRAKAPARVSFGGGGTDLTQFFLEHGGAVLNATINMYSRANLRKRDDRKIIIVSHDFNQTVTCDDLDGVEYDGKLDLIKAAIKLLRPDFGFELEVASDFPPSSGLGGSSVVLTSVIGCFNQLRNDPLSSYDIAELAFQAERLELSCSGGWQDQYASAFGGFNFMEFQKGSNEINTLRVTSETVDELEERLILCYTGKSHPVQAIHETQKKRMMNDQQITAFAKRTRDVAYEMKTHLLRGNIDAFGQLLHEGWTNKKTFNKDISDSQIDGIYDYAMANGAAGGKLLGAGGGGFFLFQANRDKRQTLIRALTAKGHPIREFVFDLKGLRSWIARH